MICSVIHGDIWYSVYLKYEYVVLLSVTYALNYIEAPKYQHRSSTQWPQRQ